MGTTQCGAELRVLAHGDPSDTDLRPPVFLEGLPPELKTEEGQPLELQTRIQGTPLSTHLCSFRVINKLIICVMLSYTCTVYTSSFQSISRLQIYFW